MMNDCEDSPVFIPFWREKPLCIIQEGLLRAVLMAHRRSTERDNVSTVTVINAFCGSRSFTQAVAAALCTLGEQHGPVEATYTLFFEREPLALTVESLIKEGVKVPGFGNSFFKNQPDPLWEDVSKLLQTHFPEVFARLWTVQQVLWSHGKRVCANPAGFTACAAKALEMPRHVAPWLFIAGRLDGWAKRVLHC